MAEHALAIREVSAIAQAPQPGELSVDQILGQVEKILLLMKEVLKKDEHYGVIPGTGSKPTLLKAGAEKLCLMFRLDPEYDVTERYDGDHLTVISRCTLFHITSGMRMGSGIGMCSSKESKYAYRKAQRACPKCGVAAIQKDTKGDGGYYCWRKKDGCGAQFKDAASIKSIESQETGRVTNPDLADQYNTVLKMASKRALVDAVLKVTAASDIFTQDLEDIHDKRQRVQVKEEDTGEGNAVPPTGKARWEALQSVASERLGDGGKDWLKRRLADAGAASTRALTPQIYLDVMTELDEIQSSPAIEEDADIPFGEEEQAAVRQAQLEVVRAPARE